MWRLPCSCIASSMNGGGLRRGSTLDECLPTSCAAPRQLTLAVHALHFYVCAHSMTSPILPLTSRTQLRLHTLMPNFVLPPGWNGVHAQRRVQRRGQTPCVGDGAPARAAGPATSAAAATPLQHTSAQSPWTFGHAMHLTVPNPQSSSSQAHAAAAAGRRPYWTEHVRVAR